MANEVKQTALSDRWLSKEYGPARRVTQQGRQRCKVGGSIERRHCSAGEGSQRCQVVELNSTGLRKEPQALPVPKLDCSECLGLLMDGSIHHSIQHSELECLLIT